MAYAKSAYLSLADGPVRSEMRRMARKLIKDKLKAEGVKISDVEASAISAAVEALLSDKDTGNRMLKAAKRSLRTLGGKDD